MPEDDTKRMEALVAGAEATRRLCESAPNREEELVCDHCLKDVESIDWMLCDACYRKLQRGDHLSCIMCLVAHPKYCSPKCASEDVPEITLTTLEKQLAKLSREREGLQLKIARVAAEIKRMQSDAD